MKALKGSQILVMFGGEWFIASEDIKYLIYHVTSKNHTILTSSNFMIWNSS